MYSLSMKPQLQWLYVSITKHGNSINSNRFLIDIMQKSLLCLRTVAWIEKCDLILIADRERMLIYNAQ